MHVFRVETHRDLSAWTRVLVQGCHAAAELIKEVTVGECCRGAGTPGSSPCSPPGLTAAVPAGCTLGGQEVQLSIHYEGGFTISRDEPGASVLFRYPYERLKMSADDGIRTLYLDFGGPEGELVRRGQPASPPGLRGSSPCFLLLSPIPAASQLPRLTGFGWLEPPALQSWDMGAADTTLHLPPGAGPALLPQAHRLRPAHLPVGQSHPHGAAGIGASAPSPCHQPAGGHRGPPNLSCSVGALLGLGLLP